MTAAVRYYELSPDRLPEGWALSAQCYQTGREVPLDATLATELFQMAADSGNSATANSFGCCLERGDGVKKDMDRGVPYDRKAALQVHPGGLCNYGRCLGYDKGIPQDFIRGAKDYRMAADLTDPIAEKSFEISLEGGIGVNCNIPLAVRYY